MKEKLTLPFIGRTFTPLAMVIVLAMRINDSITVTGYWVYLLLAASVCTGVGIEVVGILSGRNVEVAYRNKQWVDLVAASVVLTVYVALAMVLLYERNTVLFLLPVMAALVYLASAQAEGLAQRATVDQVAEEQQSNFQLQQAGLQAQHLRNMEQQKQQAELQMQLEVQLEKEKLQADVAKATAEQKAKVAIATQKAKAQQGKLPVQRRKQQAMPESNTAVASLTPAQRRVYDVVLIDQGATSSQLAEKLGVTRQAVDRHLPVVRKALNGHGGGG